METTDFCCVDACGEVSETRQKMLHSALPHLNVSVPAEKLYRALMTIRFKFILDEKHQNFLNDHGVVAKLIPLLERPNSKIVDISLSILGNLVLFKRPRTEARKENVVRVLVRIVSTLNEEKILGRACRAIANVGLDQPQDFHQLGTVPLLLRILKEVKCNKAKSCAIRAIRILCLARNHRKIATDNEAVAAITSYIHSEDVELVRTVAKSLSVLSGDNPLVRRSLVEQMRVESDQFKIFLQLLNHPRKSVWVPILVTLANLSHDGELRPQLGNIEMLPPFIEKLSDHEDSLSDVEFVQCVSSLCLYSGESVNRVKLCESNGLKLFLDLLSSHRHRHKAVHDKILHSLLMFRYGMTSLRYMQWAGLVPSLVRFLEEYNEVAGKKWTHQCEATQDLPNEPCLPSVDDESSSSPFSGNVTPVTSEDDDYCGDDDGDDDGGPSAAKKFKLEEPVSGSSSADLSMDSFTADSTMDTTTDELMTPIDEITKHMVSLAEEVQDKITSGWPHRGWTKDDNNILPLQLEKRIFSVLTILERLFQSMMDPLEPLTRASVATALINYNLWTPNRFNSIVEKILTCLSKDHRLVMPLVEQGFFPWLLYQCEDRLVNCNIKRCDTCRDVVARYNRFQTNLSTTAGKHRFIEGNVCHTLVTGGANNVLTSEAKVFATTGIICLWRSKRFLYNLLIVHGGLEVLLETVESGEPQLFSYATLSLSLAASALKVKSQIDLEDDASIRLDKRCYYLESLAEMNLSLRLDNATVVKANRCILVEANAVFEAMLTGRFIESNMNEVALCKASNRAVMCLVHYLYGCRQCPTVDGEVLNDDLETLLNLVPLSDQYLLTDFHRCVCQKIMRLATRNIGQIVHVYRGSLEISSVGSIKEDTLSIGVISFLLVAEMPHRKRVKLFGELIRSEMASDFLDDIGRILRSKLFLAASSAIPEQS